MFLLALVAACGGATPSQSGPAIAPTPQAPATAASASDSAQPPAAATSAAPAASTSAPADSSDDATAESSDDEKLDPLASPAAKYKAVDKPVPNLPLLVSVPATAVLKPERADAATVSPEGKEGYGVMSIESRSILFEPLDKELAELDRQHLKVVSKRGSGNEYSIVYKPYPNMFTYEKFLTVGGKDLECLVEGLYHRDEIPLYDAICKSLRAKKK
jgi:hypothetical protein